MIPEQVHVQIKIHFLGNLLYYILYYYTDASERICNYIRRHDYSFAGAGAAALVISTMTFFTSFLSLASLGKGRRILNVC